MEEIIEQLGVACKGHTCVLEKLCLDDSHSNAATPPVLGKVMRYAAGSIGFREHSDTRAHMFHVGTMVLIAPRSVSAFTGGDLVVQQLRGTVDMKLAEENANPTEDTPQPDETRMSMTYKQHDVMWRPVVMPSAMDEVLPAMWSIVPRSLSAFADGSKVVLHGCAAYAMVETLGDAAFSTSDLGATAAFTTFEPDNNTTKIAYQQHDTRWQPVFIPVGVMHEVLPVTGGERLSVAMRVLHGALGAWQGHYTPATPAYRRDKPPRDDRYVLDKPVMIDLTALDQGASATLPSAEDLRAYITYQNGLARDVTDSLLAASKKLNKKIQKTQREIMAHQMRLRGNTKKAGSLHQPEAAETSITLTTSEWEEDIGDAALAGLSYDELMVLASQRAALMSDEKLAKLNEAMIVCADFEREEVMTLAWLAGEGDFDMWWGVLKVPFARFLPEADRLTVRDSIMEAINTTCEVTEDAVPSEFVGDYEIILSHEAEATLAAIDCWDKDDGLIGLQCYPEPEYNDEGHDLLLRMYVPCLYVKRRNEEP
jgi:hypothetical protein